jgi:tetratricopeptide (TPR) repeat protein
MKRVLLPLLLSLAAAAPALAGADGDLSTLFDHGALRRASALAEERLAADPADAVALGVLARIRARQARFDEAIALGKRAVKAAPRSATAHYALAEAEGQSAESGGPLKGLGAARAFKREAEAALALEPNHADALGGLIQFYRLAPGIVGGDKKKAAELTDRLAAADPVRGWLQRAQDAVRARDSTRADQCWHKAAEAEVQGTRAKVALASWLASTERDLPEAERLAAQAAAAEPWRIGAWQLLAAVQAHQRRWPDLEATLARAESETGGRLDATYTAARQLLVEKAEPARAERLMRRYLEREPEIGALPESAARWRLAQALEQQARKPEAIAELQAALRLDPKFEPAKKDLKRLKG